MSVSAVSAGQSAPVSPERAEGPGPDRDGDSDDSSSVQAQSQTKAATESGVGDQVDKSA